MPTSSGEIARRWPRFAWDLEGRSRWQLWEARHFLYPVAFASLIGLVYLELALWRNGSEPWWPFGPSLRCAGGAAFLVAAFLLNSWSLDCFMAGKTKIEAEIPPWIRGLRFAAAGVPGLGLLVLAAWRWMLTERPGWLRQEKRVQALDLQSPRFPSLASSSGIERRRRTASQSPVFLVPWLISAQILPYLAILSWLGAGPFTSGRRWVAVGACGLLHLTAFGCVAGYTRLRRPRTSRGAGPLLRFGPWLLLLPFPFTCLGILAWLPAAEENQEEKTLSHQAYTQRNHVPRPDLQSRPVDSLRSAWQVLQQTRRELHEALQAFFENPSEAGEWGTGRLAFYRLKTLLLVFDAAALAWVVTHLGRPVLTLESRFSALTVFLVLAGLGLLVEAAFLGARAVGWLRRTVPPYFPYGRYLALTQLALPIGLLAGTQVALGDGHGLGFVLWHGGLAAAVSGLLVLAPVSFLFSLPGRETVIVLTWAALHFELFVAGVIMRTHPELSPPFLSYFRLALALTPLWSIGLFLALGQRLLQPFKLRHIFKPGLPARARMVLALVLVTAALPLGGVAIPFWMCARQRLWLRYEKLLGV